MLRDCVFCELRTKFSLNFPLMFIIKLSKVYKIYIIYSIIIYRYAATTPRLQIRIEL